MLCINGFIVNESFRSGCCFEGFFAEGYGNTEDYGNVGSSGFSSNVEIKSRRSGVNGGSAWLDVFRSGINGGSAWLDVTVLRGGLRGGRDTGLMSE